MKAILALCSILAMTAAAPAAAKDVVGNRGRAETSKQSVKPKDANATRTKKADKEPTSWRDYKKTATQKRGFVRLQSTVGSWTGNVLGKRKEILPQAKTAFARVFASWRTGKRCEISPRLIAMVVKLSDTFGGRTIIVASGYREHSYFQDSRHRTGEAVDLSIEGVPNEFLRDYLRTLNGVAVGYYPNSSFVHLDVRGYSAYWVDYAGPGQRPQSSKPRRAAKAARARDERDTAQRVTSSES